MINDNLCCICKEEGEHNIHLFIDCDYARMFLECLGVDAHVLNTDFFLDWFEGFLTSRSKEECQLLCMGIWELCSQRNSIYRDEKVALPPIAARLCKNFLSDFSAAKSVSLPARRVVRSPDWSPPSVGRSKLNIEASCPPTRACIGWGEFCVIQPVPS